MKKKSSFWKFIFSLVPGAGQMYLGFMRQGAALMFAFFFTIFLVDYFRVSFVIAILPVLWCYSFFDSLNKGSLSAEEIEVMEDKTMFDSFLSAKWEIFSGRFKWVGIILISLGVLLMLDNVVFPELARLALIDRYICSQYLRTFIIAGVLIGLGVKLIAGKKRSQ